MIKVTHQNQPDFSPLKNSTKNKLNLKIKHLSIETLKKNQLKTDHTFKLCNRQALKWKINIINGLVRTAN